MLRLVYHTTTFGPLHLDYDDAVVRAGSSRDNDLIILHESVQPHHCLLLFEEEAVIVLSFEEGMPVPPQEVPDDAPRFGVGDILHVGQLPFEIERSPNSVAVVRDNWSETTNDGKTPEGYWKADALYAPDEARWLCDFCRIRLLDRQLKLLGLQGRKKHLLCPVCGHEVTLFSTGTKKDGSIGQKLRSVWKQSSKKLAQLLRHQ